MTGENKIQRSFHSLSRETRPPRGPSNSQTLVIANFVERNLKIFDGLSWNEKRKNLVNLLGRQTLVDKIGTVKGYV